MVVTITGRDRYNSMFYACKRLLHILMTILIYGLDDIILPRYLCPSKILYLLPYFRQKHQLPLGERLFLACVHLGPLAVKLGQLVSIRHDIFPDSITKPLGRLQDQVPPFASVDAINRIESALGATIKQLFLTFDPTPIASASIAQVHQATLHDHSQVVIKVLRPHIRLQVNIDIRLIRGLIHIMGLLRRVPKQTLLALMDEYKYTINQELNLKHEASHYSQMRHYFDNDERLYVPKIHWSHTHKDVMTVEKIHGITIDKINDYPDVDRKVLAYNGVHIFFSQVFIHRFFHADMHPGNVFVDITDPKAPKYVAIDFGITGTLSPTDQYYLAENFLAFFHRDYTRVAQLHIDAGWVDKSTDLLRFEAAIRHVCEPIFAKTIEEISIAELLHQIVEVSKPFNLHIQPQLLLLQKTLFHVEALGRKLYPQLNIWVAAKPFLETFMQQRSSLKTGWSHLKQELPRLLSHSPQLPYLLHQQLQTTPPVVQKPEYIPTILYGIIIGALLTNPNYLTNPTFIYILCSSLIIIIAWKCIK